MIEKVIKYLSENFFGTEKDPEDVKIKYLVEDEDYPYWWVLIDGCYKFKEYQKLNDFLTEQGYFLVICSSKGFWICEKQYEKQWDGIE
jgi:hypothetical protein